jgi:hypothetical protein
MAIRSCSRPCSPLDDGHRWQTYEVTDADHEVESARRRTAIPRIPRIRRAPRTPSAT